MPMDELLLIYPGIYSFKKHTEFGTVLGTRGTSDSNIYIKRHQRGECLGVSVG